MVSTSFSCWLTVNVLNIYIGQVWYCDSGKSTGNATQLLLAKHIQSLIARAIYGFSHSRFTAAQRTICNLHVGASTVLRQRQVQLVQSADKRLTKEHVGAPCAHTSTHAHDALVVDLSRTNTPTEGKQQWKPDNS